MTATKQKRRSGNPAKPPKPPYRPEIWHRNHRFALFGIVGATSLTLLVGFLGPSAVTLTLGPRESYLPPWYLPIGMVKPNEWFVSLLIWAAILLGALGLWVGLRALADGWKPKFKKLFALGAVLSLLTICVPPMTSADVLMYAAYGRLQAIGRDPYDITPAEVFRGQFDPVLRWTERPWQDTPSVYGPITSWTQLTANKLGGENMHDIVFWLQLFSVVPFILACAGVLLLARGDTRRQGRVALLTIVNPLLIWAVVAGAHNESLAVMFAVGGMLFMRKNPFVAGLGIGLAGCAKVSIGLWGLAMLWAYRREPKKAAAALPGHCCPDGSGLCAVAANGFPPSAAQRWLCLGRVLGQSVLSPLGCLPDWIPGQGHRRRNLLHRLDRDRLDAFPGGALDRRLLVWTGMPTCCGIRSPIALRTALVLSVAWLITSMYTLSWYDLLAWMPLAVLAASKLDKIMLIRGTALSLAYVPGRAIDVGPVLDFTATRMRDTVSPIIQMAMILAVILWWRQPDRPELFPFKKQKPSAGSSPTVSARCGVQQGTTTAQLAVESSAFSSGCSPGQGAGVAA